MSAPETGDPQGDILVVDDTPANLQLLTALLRKRGHKVRPVPSGAFALIAAKTLPPDLIMLDINMLEMDGYAVCMALKRDPLLCDIPVIFVSANAETLDQTRAFAVGGVDYVTKPFRFEEVASRVATHLKIGRLQREVKGLTDDLQTKVKAQSLVIADAQVAAILAMVKLADCRLKENGSHVLRIQLYCRALGERLAGEGAFPEELNEAFIETLFCASALCDIGKVGIPDQVLMRPGPLGDEERLVMQGHVDLATGILTSVLEGDPENPYVRMGRDIARAHHENWDGSGYPAGLEGASIPLSARIASFADRYDALRSERPYQNARDAHDAVVILTQGDHRGRPEHFDPRIMATFKSIVEEFDAIFTGVR